MSAGALDADSPTWHRGRPLDTDIVGLACDLPLLYEYALEPAYELVCFEVLDDGVTLTPGDGY